MEYEILKDTVVDGIYGVLDGGTYSQYDLVVCYLLEIPYVPYCKFEARYIVLGSQAYE
jgi:hypothetical protein